MFSKIISIYLQGWKLTRKNLLFLIGTLGGVFLFLELLFYLNHLAIESWLVGITTSLLAVFSFCLFSLGITNIFVKLSSKEDNNFMDLFSQWNQTPGIFIVNLLAVFILILLIIYFMFFAISSGLPNLFSLALIIVVVSIFLLFFSFVNLVMVKYQMGPINSLKYNFQVVKKDIFAVFVFYLFFFIINFVAVLLFYIGLIVTLPLTLLAQAIFLDKLEEY